MSAEKDGFKRGGIYNACKNNKFYKEFSRIYIDNVDLPDEIWKTSEAFQNMNHL